MSSEQTMLARLRDLTPVSQRVAAAIGLVLGLAAGALQALTILAIADAVGHPGAGSFTTFAATATAFIVATAVSQVLIARLCSHTGIVFRLAMLERCLRMPLELAETVERKGLMTLVLDYVRWVALGVICTCVLASRVGVLTVATILVGRWSPWLALATALSVAIAFAIYVVSRTALFSAADASAKAQRESVVDLAREGVQRVKELKLSVHRYEAFRARIAAALAAQTTGWSVVGRAALVDGVVFVVLLAPPVAAIVRADAWHLTPDVLGAYAMVTLALFIPLTNVPKLIENIVSSRETLLEIQRHIYDVSTHLEHEPDESLEAPAWKRIQLRDVTFRYAGEEHEPFQLGPLSLEIERGTIVFVASGNGNGKTTLAKVIAGLYPPQRGVIALDDTSIDAAWLAAYRSQFSAVFTDLYLPESLDGIPNVHDAAQVTMYLEKLQLADKVKVVDGKLSTTALSDGQRKRLALLVAYLEDRAVYVFDEWASDQDPNFRRVFYTELLPELKRRGKTIIAVTHDEPYFGVADRIVKLERGQLRDPAVTS